MPPRKPKAPVVSLVPKPAKPEPWTPLAMLEQFVEEVRTGKLQPTGLMIFTLNQLPNGNRQPETWLANVSVEERIAFCQLETARALKDWQQ